MPRTRRPPESACRVAAIFARCAGLRKLLQSTSWPQSSARAGPNDASQHPQRATTTNLPGLSWSASNGCSSPGTTSGRGGRFRAGGGQNTLRGGYGVRELPPMVEGQDEQGLLHLPIIIDAERTVPSTQTPEVSRIPPLGRGREGETVEPS